MVQSVFNILQFTDSQLRLVALVFLEATMLVDGVGRDKLDLCEFQVLAAQHILSVEEVPVMQATVEDLVRFVYRLDNNFILYINNTK
jgi:hypothetical protein